MVFSLPPAKNPSRAPSGDQNGCPAPSVPGSTRSSARARSRIRIFGTPEASDAATARRRPSGETAVLTVSRVIATPSGSRADMVAGSAAGGAGRSMVDATTAAATTAASAPDQRARVRRRAGASSGIDGRSSRRRRASPASRSRSRGSFFRQRPINVRMCAGVSAGSAFQLTSSFSTAASVVEVSSPPKARRPASISNRTDPHAQMSARRSTDFPRACSGDM